MTSRPDDVRREMAAIDHELDERIELWVAIVAPILDERDRLVGTRIVEEIYLGDFRRTKETRNNG